MPYLTILWHTHLRHGRRHLLALGDLCAVAPVFAAGYGVGDLIIGDALIDVKVHREPAARLPQYVDQLLRYVLLDTDDDHGLRNVAVYLGWQGGLLTAEIAELTNADLAVLRRRFRSEFQDLLDFRQRWYEHQTQSSSRT